jgi:hypothetical protein
MIHQWSLMIVNGAYKPTYGTMTIVWLESMGFKKHYKPAYNWRAYPNLVSIHRNPSDIHTCKSHQMIS